MYNCVIPLPLCVQTLNKLAHVTVLLTFVQEETNFPDRLRGTPLSLHTVWDSVRPGLLLLTFSQIQNSPSYSHLIDLFQ
jgi:hypothetical protein